MNDEIHNETVQESEREQVQSEVVEAPTEIETAANGDGVAEAVSSESVESGIEAKAVSPDSEAAEVEDEDPEIQESDVLALPVEVKTAIVEALLIASGEPLSRERIQEASKLPLEEIENVVSLLKARYQDTSHGLELVCVADKYQLRTKARFGQFIRALKASAPRRLSHAALETISIVAYRQPIVKSDVEKIRGVDATPTIKTLLERNLIKIVGHQQSVGQPALYGTTDEFLKLFGLTSLEQLPTLRDLKELERDPGESEQAAAA